MKGIRQQALVYSLILFLLFPVACSLWPVSAHLIGQPPYLKINGQYANLYPVPLTSLNNFDLPQDLAPDNYLVNQPVSFELDKGRLPVPPEIIEKTKFNFDFTDNTHEQGLIVSHTFTKMGSYIVKIYADDGTTPKPQIIESILVNIVPNKNYLLPQAKIIVNDKFSKDPLTDILQFSFQDKLEFDARKSSGQASIVEFFWDFGDQKSAFGPTQTHQYPNDLSQTFVVLRVKDKNGFLGDAFVEIQNSLNGQNSTASSSIAPSSQPPPKKGNQLPFVLVGIVVMVTVLLMARWFVQGRYRGKHQ